MALQIRRGTYAEIQTIIPVDGELIYATDTEQLFVGDGSTVGGISVTPLIGDLTVTNTEIDGVPATLLSDNLSTGTITLINVASGNQIAVSTTASVVTGPMFAGTVTLNTLKFSSDGIAITSRNELLGYTGSIGYAGSQGITGYTGSLGAQGPIGYTGSLGYTGSIGYTGSLGAQGAQGVQGFTGSVGAQGAQGAQGAVGYTGSLGAQGVQGAQGYTGSLGAQGVQGDVGYTGSHGATGAQGTQGIQGYTGSQGSAGAAGADGDRYHTSSTSTLTISNTGTLTLYTADLNLDYSQQQTVLIAYDEANHMHGRVVTYNGATGELVVNLNNSSGSGSYSVWEINLDGAVGIRGYTGSQGAQGIQGEQGIIGYTGSQGESGAQGSVGYTGSLGAQGAQGVSGYTGSQGIQGDQGVTGYTGSQGESGLQGSVGYTGSQGESGLQGSVGYTGSQGEAGLQGSVGYTGSQGDIGYTGSSGASVSTVDNFGAGYDALVSLTSGLQNVAVGPNAGSQGTDFQNNTLVGWGAGQRLTANNNVAVGTLALNSGTAVEYNVMLGNEAGKNLTGPQNGRNIFVGFGAGSDFTTSQNNILIGTVAGQSMTTGNNNTIIGEIALADGTTSTVIIAAGTTERIKVDDTGLSINGAPFTSADIANFTFTTDTITSDGNISLVANTDGDIFVELSTDAGNPSFAVKVDNNNKFLVHNTSATFVVNEVKFGTSGSTATITTDAGNLILNPGGSKIFLNKNTQFTGFQETRVAAAYTATFAPDVSTATIWAMTLTGGVTFNGFTNPLAGQSATVVFTQDSGGNRTLTSTMKFVGGSKTLSTAGTSTDIVSVFYDGTTYWASLSKGYA